MVNNYGTWAKWLLLVGGLVHGLPPLYTWLAGITGGYPWAQVFVGWVSVVVALMAMKA